jgi:hypothetical protein
VNAVAWGGNEVAGGDEAATAAQTAAHVRPTAVVNLALSLAQDGFLVLGRGEGEGEADLAPALLALPGLDAIFARNPAFRTLEV